MDRFTISRQSITFLGFVGIIGLVLAIGFPVGSILMGFLGLLILGAVWLKTVLRTKKWFWWNLRSIGFTQTEGAMGLSAAILLCIGIAVVMSIGIRVAHGREVDVGGYLWPGWESPIFGGGGSVHYSDPAMQQEFKDALRRAGIPAKVEMFDEKEFISWSKEYQAAVEKIQRDVLSVSSEEISYSNPLMQQQFKDALAKAGIPTTKRVRHGAEYIGWSTEYKAAVEKIQSDLIQNTDPRQMGLPYTIRFEGPGAQEKVKSWLDSNGIPYKTLTINGSEYVQWDASVDMKVRAYIDAPCKAAMATSAKQASEQRKC